MPEARTFAVQLVQEDGTSTTGAYVSLSGGLPKVGDVIPVDEHGGSAVVTEVWPDEQPPIRAQIDVIDWIAGSVPEEQADC